MSSLAYAEDDGYQPGVCNIGPAEIRRRQRVGLVGAVAALGLAALLLLVQAPAWTRLTVALPVAGSLSGFMQARCKFCTGYALAGLQNLGELGEERRIEDDEARAADRRRALAMQAVASIGGLLAGVAFWRLRV